ncbi:MAG TPA: sensor histidine kinase [Chitinophagaceae bacterium]|nr:sensor histidine kinase [Chitinophagaceae bacterium]
MMRLFILVILAFNSLGSFSQENPDSLRVIMNSKRPYQEQIDAAIKLVEHFELKNFDSTIVEGNKAIKIAQKNTDSVSIAELKRHIGVASYFKGEYDVAAKNFYESISILEKSNKPEKLAPVYNELAKLYRKTKDLDRATENYTKAETIYRNLRDTGGIAMILNESGVVYEYRKDYREAVNRYNASLKLAEASGDSVGVSYSLSNIAGVYVIERKYDLAEINLLRALHIREELRDSFALALTYSDLGAAMNAKGDYQKAVKYLSISNKIAEKLKYPELQSNNYNELSLIAKKQGDFQQAYDFYMMRSALRDSLLGLEKTKQIEELNAKYEAVQKEQQIVEQKNKIRLQNYLFIGIAGLILFSALLIYSFYKRYKMRKESQLQSEIMKQQQIAVKAVMEAEENERQRIAKDLHDGVGQMMSAAKMNLSAIESEIQFTNKEQQQSFEKTIQLVDESCREVRNVSHIMMPNALLKNNLPDAIRDFINKIGYKSLEIHFYSEGLDDRFDSNIETVLYRVIQECVNNAIKHAKATTLDISLIRDKDGISGTIEDNGQGFDISGSRKLDGIGIKNITSRIEYLKGTVDFDSAPGRGTVVGLHIPL